MCVFVGKTRTINTNCVDCQKIFIKHVQLGTDVVVICFSRDSFCVIKQLDTEKASKVYVYSNIQRKCSLCTVYD